MASSNDVPGLSPRASTVFPDDAALVQAARSGEHHAFVELFNRHSPKVLRITYRVTKNQQDAEDALQDAFLNAYVHIAKYDGRAQFSSWLVRIAINSSLIILRRRRIRPEASIDSVPYKEGAQSWDVIDYTADIEMQYLNRESVLLLRQAINRLRPSLRDIVEIQQSHDMSIKETAEVANLSIPATKSRLLRARQALRRTMC
jgi:RNA polymerase sigma factor (sigma-70 family)